jgi:hypothetical protein
MQFNFRKYTFYFLVRNVGISSSVDVVPLQNVALEQHIDFSQATWEELELHLEKKYGSTKSIKIEPTEEDMKYVIDFIPRAEFEDDEELARAWLAKFVKYNDSHPTLTRKSSRSPKLISSNEPKLISSNDTSLEVVALKTNKKKSSNSKPKVSKKSEPKMKIVPVTETKSLSQGNIAVLKNQFEEKYQTVYSNQNTDKNR